MEMTHGTMYKTMHHATNPNLVRIGSRRRFRLVGSITGLQRNRKSLGYNRQKTDQSYFDYCQ